MCRVMPAHAIERPGWGASTRVHKRVLVLDSVFYATNRRCVSSSGPLNAPQRRGPGCIFMCKFLLVLALALGLGVPRFSRALSAGPRPWCPTRCHCSSLRLAACNIARLRGGAEVVQCTFTVVAERLPGPGHTVVLTGSGVAMHSWAPWTLTKVAAEHGARPTIPKGAQWWSTTIELPVGDTVDFKFAIRSPDGVLIWEHGENRRTVVPDALTHTLTCTFGDSSALVTLPTPQRRRWPLLAEVLEWIRGLMPRPNTQSGEAHARLAERARDRRERAALWAELEEAEQPQLRLAAANQASASSSWLSQIRTVTGWALFPSATTFASSTTASPPREPSAAAAAAAAAATAAVAVAAPSLARRFLLMDTSRRFRLLVTPMPTTKHLSLTSFLRDYLVEGFNSG